MLPFVRICSKLYIYTATLKWHMEKMHVSEHMLKVIRVIQELANEHDLDH